MTDQLAKKIFDNASAIDENGKFPIDEFKWMADEKLLQITLPGNRLDFDRPNTTTPLLNLLKKTGKANLAVGRVYEGHINALYLIHIFGLPEHKKRWYDMVEHNSALFGVWNTENGDGVTISLQPNGKYLLKGIKTFCSGGNHIHQPLVTGRWTNCRNGWQMFIVPAEKVGSIKCDSSFWQPLGMRASASYKMDFTGIEIEEKDLLGHPDVYYHQPHFSGGAIRFAAVQMGGAMAVMDLAHALLKSMNRTNDGFQKARIAEMAWLVETGNLWLQQAGEKLDYWKFVAAQNNKTVAYVGMARTIIEEICNKVLQLAEKSVGARGLMQPNPLERMHRDLTIYLKQPGPDATIVSIGEHLFKQPTLNDCWE